MKGMGIGALLLAGLSFFLWLISWSYFNFIAEEVGYGGPVHFLAKVCGFLDQVTLMLAIVLLALGLIIGPKKSNRD